MANRKKKEVEVKLRVMDVAKAKRALRRLRARSLGRVHEMNTLLDTPQSRLRKRGHLLRLRVVTPHGKRGPAPTGLVTYKGPSLRLENWRADSEPRRAAAGPARGQRYKVRDEIEASVAQPARMAAILRALGLFPSFRYEKYRTTYELPRVRGVKVELDETPIGTFFELEGTPRAIDRAARLLGYDSRDYITLSYLALHLRDRRRRGVKVRDMLFRGVPQRRPEQKKLC